MSEKRFRFERECTENFFTEKGVFYNNERPMGANEIIALLNSLADENEQLQQELREMDKLLKSYRETIKHDAELLADATRNGYLPPLDDFVKG